MFIKIILGITSIIACTLLNSNRFKSKDELELKYLRSLERLEKANINYTKNKLKQLTS